MCLNSRILLWNNNYMCLKVIKMRNLTKWIWLTSSEKSPRCLTSSVSVRSCISSRETTFFVFNSRTRPSARGASTVGALSSMPYLAYSITVWSSSDWKCSIAFGPSTTSSPGCRRYKEWHNRILIHRKITQLSYPRAFTWTDSLSCLFVSSVVFVSTIGPESSITFPSSNTICRFTLVSICRVVVNSVFFFVTTSSMNKKERRNAPN